MLVTLAAAGLLVGIKPCVNNINTVSDGVGLNSRAICLPRSFSSFQVILASANLAQYLTLFGGLMVLLDADEKDGYEGTHCTCAQLQDPNPPALF